MKQLLLLLPNQKKFYEACASNMIFSSVFRFSPPQDINGFKPDSHDLDGFLDDDEPPTQTRINPAATLEESSDDGA